MRRLTVALCAVFLTLSYSSAQADLYAFDGILVDVEYWGGLGYGNGDNSAMLVVDFGSDSFAFGYTWTGGAPTGMDMLSAVDAGGSFSHTPAGVTVTGMSYDGNTFDNAALFGSWTYYDSADGTTWNLAGTTPGSTTLSDTDWDGYAIQFGIYADPDGAPTTPVPEPATGILVALGAGVMLVRSRKRKSA